MRAEEVEVVCNHCGCDHPECNDPELNTIMKSKYLINSDLPDLVGKTYQRALAASKVIYTESDKVDVIQTSTGLHFQLRFCPSLAKKPTAHDANDHKDRKPKRENPFLNPDLDMVIAQLPTNSKAPTHTLILNKFPIIAEHFMLITKEAKDQTHALEKEDLEAVYACLKAWSEHDIDGQKRQLFAFFNSGPFSGASQAHRHVQFLPVESMRKGIGDQHWPLLLDDLPGHSPVIDRLISWCGYRDALTDVNGDTLLAVYLDLLERAENAVNHFVKSNPGSLELHDTRSGASAFSYNLGMTQDRMVIFPRRRDGMKLQDNDGKEVGYACLNGTLLGGSLMVKHREEYETLRSSPCIMDEILEEIGIPMSLDNARI